MKRIFFTLTCAMLALSACGTLSSLADSSSDDNRFQDGIYSSRRDRQETKDAIAGKSTREIKYFPPAPKTVIVTAGVAYDPWYNSPAWYGDPWYWDPWYRDPWYCGWGWRSSWYWDPWYRPFGPYGPWDPWNPWFGPYYPGWGPRPYPYGPWYPVGPVWPVHRNVRAQSVNTATNAGRHGAGSYQRSSTGTSVRYDNGYNRVGSGTGYNMHRNPYSGGGATRSTTGGYNRSSSTSRPTPVSTGGSTSYSRPRSSSGSSGATYNSRSSYSTGSSSRSSYSTGSTSRSSYSSGGYSGGGYSGGGSHGSYSGGGGSRGGRR